MVHPQVLALAGGVALLVPVAEAWSRYWGAAPENWPRRALVRAGSGLLILALIGFDGAFGIVPDPGVPSGMDTAVELALVGLALVAYVGGLWLREAD